MTMIPFPTIQIRQQYAKINFDADLGQYEIRQPRPYFEMHTTKPQLDVTPQKGELTIDQSRAFEGYGVGPHLDWLKSIYSESKNVALQGIARRVENGNRMWAIHIKTDPIPEIAAREAFMDVNVVFPGPVSYHPVETKYTPKRPIVKFEYGDVHVDSHPNPPEIEYHKGKFELYQVQKASVEIIPPEIDLTL